MKFFRLLYICLISFIASPFLYGMDFGMDLSDVPTDWDLRILEKQSSESTKIDAPLNKNQGLVDVLYFQENKQPTRHFITSVTTMGPVSKIFTEENDLVTKDATIPLLTYPSIAHPIANVFVDINSAKVKSDEGLLARVLKAFKDNPSGKYRGFTVRSSDLLRINQTSQLKEDIFKRYLLDPSKTYPLSQVQAEITQLIPRFLSVMYAYQQQKMDDHEKKYLILLTQRDIVDILYRLKESNESLDANTLLVYDIITKTVLDHQKTQASLLLLHKIGKFYPEIKSDFAITLIDDIAAYYVESVEKQESQEQKYALMSRIIKLLNSVPLLEPLFSGTLQIAAITQEKLEDYLEKIELLQRNINLSPDVREKLQQMRNNILEEQAQRVQQAAIAQARLQAAKQAKLEAEEKVLQATKKVARLKAEQKRLQAEQVELHATKQAKLELEKQALKIKNEIDQLKVEQAQLQAAEAEAQLKELQQNRDDVTKIEQIIELDRLEKQEKINRAREEEAKQNAAKQTPSFLQYLQKGVGNILSTIQSWFNWFSWEQYRS